MLRPIPVLILSVVISCLGASGQAVPPAAKNSMERRVQVWTNENIQSLRSISPISVVGQAQDQGPVSQSAKPGNSPANIPAYVPNEKNPAWYGKQLNQIDSELIATSDRISQIQSAIEEGKTSDSVVMVVDYSELGVSTGATLQMLEERKRELSAKADALEDMARENDLEPGMLRSAEAEASSEQSRSSPPVTAVVEQRSAPDAPRDESYWRSKFAGLRHQLDQARAQLGILQREWGTLLVQYYPDPSRTMRESYTRHEINEHKQEINEKKQEIARLTQRISDREDDLRKSGGDAGWARP